MELNELRREIEGKMGIIHERINGLSSQCNEMKPVLDRVEVNQAHTVEALGDINETLVRMDERAEAKKRLTKMLVGIVTGLAAAVGAVMGKIIGGS